MAWSVDLYSLVLVPKFSFGNAVLRSSASRVGANPPRDADLPIKAELFKSPFPNGNLGTRKITESLRGNPFAHLHESHTDCKMLVGQGKRFE